jgi:membrane protein involved in colicin uptake
VRNKKPSEPNNVSNFINTKTLLRMKKLFLISVAALSLCACGGSSNKTGAAGDMDSLQALTEQVEALSTNDTVDAAKWTALRTQFEALSAKAETQKGALSQDEKDLLTKLEQRFTTAESTVNKKIEAVKGAAGTSATDAANAATDVAKAATDAATGTANDAVDAAAKAAQNGINAAKGKVDAAKAKAQSQVDAAKAQAKAQKDAAKAQVEKKKKEVDAVKTSAKNLGDAVKGLR